MELEFSTLSQLDRVDGLEALAVKIAGYLAEDVEDYTHGAAVFTGRPGPGGPRIVVALHDQAAWTNARVQAKELAASTRRLWDKYLRTVVTTEELVHHAANAFQIFVSKETDGGEVPNGESM